MNIEVVKAHSVWHRFVYWIEEREKIRLAKEAGLPKPWTDDVILQSYRFCNVRRMDDKVSRWLLENWYKPYQDHHWMIWACGLARFFNNPDSLALITDQVFKSTVGRSAASTRIKKTLREYAKSGHTIFNGAYMVRGNDGEDKISSVVDYYCSNLFEIRWHGMTNSMKELWTAVCSKYGFGSFMAGQIVADMRHAAEGKWEDKNSWAPMGPGSKRGMNRLLERPLNQPITQREFEERLEKITASLDADLDYSVGCRLEAIDRQNCLCEFDKYERTLFDNRRPKQKYQGTN